MLWWLLRAGTFAGSGPWAQLLQTARLEAPHCCRRRAGPGLHPAHHPCVDTSLQAGHLRLISWTSSCTAESFVADTAPVNGRADAARAVGLRVWFHCLGSRNVCWLVRRRLFHLACTGCVPCGKHAVHAHVARSCSMFPVYVYQSHCTPSISSGSSPALAHFLSCSTLSQDAVSSLSCVESLSLDSRPLAMQT